MAAGTSTYKARIELEKQQFKGPEGNFMNVGAGMQLVSEIHQGKRTVLEYLLSPVAKAAKEAAREK